MDQEQQPENTWISAASGAKIRKARNDKDLSQAQLAARVNASAAQIDHYERGGLAMPVARLFDIAAELGVCAADLLAD